MRRWVVVALAAAACGRANFDPSAQFDAPSLDAPVTVDYGWARIFGGPNVQSVSDLRQDGAGDLYFTGITWMSGLNFGGGSLNSAGMSDPVIASLTEAGSYRWAERFGGSGYDTFATVVVGTDLYMGGLFEGSVAYGGLPLASAGGQDIVVRSATVSGSYRWAFRYGSTANDNVQDIVLDSTGAVIVAGQFGANIDFGGGMLANVGGADIYVARFASDGSYLGSMRIAGPGNEGITVRLAVDAADNVYVVGAFDAPFDAGGGTLSNQGARDMFIASYAAGTWNHRWSRRFATAYMEPIARVSIGPDGNVYVTARFTGHADFGGPQLTSIGQGDILIACLDPSGGLRWQHQIGEALNETPSEVTFYGSNLYLTGSFHSTLDLGGAQVTSAGGSDIFVASFDQGGQLRWARSYGGPAEDSGASVVASSTGVYIDGITDGTVDFGGGVLTTAGLGDLWIAKLVEH